MQDSSQPKRHRVSDKVLKAASLVVLILLLLWGRAFYSSMQDYKTGETLFRENQTVRAVTYFDRALHWYAPLSPYAERAAKRLWEIGEKAESDGDTRMARIAFESIRSGFYAASHLLVPGRSWIERADSKLEALGKRTEKSAGKPKDPHPDPIWSVVVVTGFLGWIGSAAAWIHFVLGRKEPSRAWVTKPGVWIGTGLVCFSLWILGMAMA